MESTTPTPSTPQSTDQRPPTQNPQPPVSAASSPTTAAVSSPNPLNAQSQQSTSSQTRPAFNTRPWQQPTSPYSHFSLPPPPLLSSSSASTPSTTAPPPSFSSLAPPSFAQQSQVRHPTQGMQGIGMTGALGTTSSMRPAGGVPSQQFKPSQSPQRPQIVPSSQSPASQNFQGHGMLRAPSLGSSASQSPNSQSTQTHNQPWLSSGTQGKPPLPSPSIRPQATPQSFQQRPHIPQQHHNMPTSSQKQMITSGQQVAQPSTSGQQQEHHCQQLPSSRVQSPSSHQQQITKGPGLGGQRPPMGMAQSGLVQSGPLLRTASLEIQEFSNRVVSKRSIQELVNQIDPSEKLDPEVEDILVEIAEDFVESITTFGCSLAKHRKSTTLEAKDILIHLERNWNMTLPGFGGDEIKTYKKPFVADIHKERLAVIKKSMVAPVAQTGGKGHMGKASSYIIGSPPKPKLREAA